MDVESKVGSSIDKVHAAVECSREQEPEQWLPLTESVVLCLSLLIAAVAVWRNHVINRRKATIDLVLGQKQDEHYQNARDTFRRLRENGDGLGKYASKDQADSDETQAILAILNQYEFIASGIREGAFCRALYQRMQHGVFVKDYRKLQGFIADLRQDRSHDTLFQEFEWLAKKFMKKPLKKNN